MSSNEVWATCGDCSEELKQSDKQCPKCGSTKKAYGRKASVALGLEPSSSYEHEGLRKDEKKDSGSRYLEQFDRMKRWYEEFKLTDQGRPHDRSSDFYQDQVYAFFQNCWHLKEWVKNDNDELYRELHGKIHGDTDMMICQDICNGTKHLELKQRNRPEFEQRNFKVAVGSGSTTISVKYTIDISGGRRLAEAGYPNGFKIDAFDLAKKCLEFWVKFIQEQVQSKTGTK